MLGQPFYMNVFSERGLLKSALEIFYEFGLSNASKVMIY